MNKYTRDVVLMLCIACAALSFEKCTGKSDGNTSDKNAVETVDDNKVENDAEEETNETTKIKISEGTAFYDGVAFIKTDGTGKCEEGRYAIDTEGNILYKLDDGIDEDILYFDGVASYDNKIVDKKGNVLASPETTGYTKLLTPYCDGHAIAAYFEEKYPESILKIGVLNGEGEWSVPLSEDNCLLKAIKKRYKGGPFGFQPNSIMEINTGWLIDSEKNDIRLYDNSGNASYFEYYKKDTFRFNSTSILYNVEKNEISKLKEGDEEVKDIYKEYEYVSDGMGRYYDCVSKKDGYRFKVDMNDTGSRFYYVVDKSGKQLFEPKKIDGYESCLCIDKEGFVLSIGDSERKDYEYYDLQGNLITEYEDIVEMQPFYNGLSYVKDYNNNHFYIDKSGKKVIE